MMAALAGGDWILISQNRLMTGATDYGKTWRACATTYHHWRTPGSSKVRFAPHNPAISNEV
jgi:hypothetical protein